MSPSKVGGIGGIDFPRPVIAEAHGLNLAAEVLNILGRGDPRMSTRLDRMLLCRKSKGIPTHGMKNIVSTHPPVSRDNIRRGVSFKVANMKTCPRGVGEHV